MGDKHATIGSCCSLLEPLGPAARLIRNIGVRMVRLREAGCLSTTHYTVHAQETGWNCKPRRMG